MSKYLNKLHTAMVYKKLELDKIEEELDKATKAFAKQYNIEEDEMYDTWDVLLCRHEVESRNELCFGEQELEFVGGVPKDNELFSSFRCTLCGGGEGFHLNKEE